MVEDRKPEVVVINRVPPYCGTSPAHLGTVNAVVYKDVVDPKTGIVDFEATKQRGEIIYVNFVLYKTGARFPYGIYDGSGAPRLLHVIRRPEDGEIERLKAIEDEATAEFERMREGMWAGGGRVVYTR